jgi:short-subunit dehydrogenase
MNTQVALVTGGASGMGQVFALRMAKNGTKVAILDRDEQGLQSTAEQSDNIYTYPCDVSDLNEVTMVVGKATESIGPVDRLVLCAAIMPTELLALQTAELVNKVMAVNYGGVVNVTQAILPSMLERKMGEVVIFGSSGGSVLITECGAYCASKAATSAYSEILIEENRNTGVHIMLVCPALVDTPLLKQATETSNPKNIQYSIENKRFADPSEIIDQVEKGLKNKTEILIPGVEAKIVIWLRRFFPRLLWKVIHHSNRRT